MQSARILYDAGQLKGANNRAYYAIYYAISAVHALDGYAYKRHKDALENFNKEYVKTEVFQETWEEKLQQLKKSGTPVIPLIFHKT